MAGLSARIIWSEPGLDGRVLTGAAWKARWKALDTEERQWVREAAVRGRRHAEPELQALVAAHAWRQLVLLPALAIGVVVFGFAMELALVLGGGSGFSVGATPIAVVAVIMAVHARRLAAAVALNIGPPST